NSMHEFVSPCANTVTSSPSPSTSTCSRVPSRDAISATPGPQRFDEVDNDDHSHGKVTSAEDELVAAGAEVDVDVPDRDERAGDDRRRGTEPGPPAAVASGDGRPRQQPRHVLRAEHRREDEQRGDRGEGRSTGRLLVATSC